MPYETRYREVDVTKQLGYDRIRIHRPKFIYFEFTGLRPSAPHWIWFGKKEVTKFCNTSYSESDIRNPGRNSPVAEPGEKFIKATEFPSGGGLPYGGPTAAGGINNPLFTNANGILSGAFYLQSNDSFNWNISVTGQQLMAIDIYGLKKSDSYSYAAAKFRGAGQYKNYWKGKEKEAYEVWVDPPRVVNDNSNDSKSTTVHNINNGTGTIKFSTGTGQRIGLSEGQDIVTHHYSNGKFVGATRTYNGQPANVYTFNKDTGKVESAAPKTSTAPSHQEKDEGDPRGFFW